MDTAIIAGILNKQYGSGVMATSRKYVSLWWLLPIVVFAMVWLFGPALITTHNATVFLGDCEEDSCALHGDLSTNIFTRNYELKQADGSIIVFHPDAAKLISWPAPKE